MNNIIKNILILLFISTVSFSQEVLTDLGMNPVLAKKYQTEKNNLQKLNAVKLDTISLPFLDDFSKEDIYPDASLWLDSNVFINRDYPIAPPTLGVATFDGVSKTGCPYDTTLANGGISLPADKLTSKPIRLDLLPSDSVYLSFFWQAKGRGNDPEPSDTLLLDFLNPTTKQWKNIWYKMGYNPASNDTAFKLVSIYIGDTAFLKNAFRFRFRNYATISGNVDHWHLDYVFLDKHRNKADTIFSDVAFAYNSRSLLKNYYAMPWEQYQSSEMKSNLSFFIRNNDTVVKNTLFKDSIFNATGGIETSYNGGGLNISAYKTNGLFKDPLFANPTLNGYSFPILSKATSFSLESVLNTTPDKNRWNDTLRFTQNFGSYYAYDDGTVEAGYGLNVFGGQIAYKFTLNSPDTLDVIQMLFNWVATNVNQRSFRLRIWNDAGGLPGSLIYEDSLVTPNYQFIDHTNWDNVVNMFYPYKLTTPKILSGTFYVGWIQYTTDLLNIGFDKNTNSNNKMFFNTGNGWTQSVIPGSWMIRPVFRDTSLIMHVDNITSETSFIIFPNPSTGKISIQTKNISALDNSEYTISIFTITGQNVYSEKRISPNSEIDISNLREGLYFVRIENKNGQMMNQKLILAK